MTEIVDDTLSDILRRTVKRGNFTHLTLVCSSIGGPFKASFRGVDHQDYRHAEGSDVADVLVEALTGRKQKPARPVRKVRQPAQRKVDDDEFDELLG